MELRRTLQQLIKQRHLTVRQLAKDLQIPESTIKTWMSGSAPRDLDAIRKAAEYFSVSSDYLLFGQDSSFAGNLEEDLEQVFQGWLLVDIKRAVKIKKKK